LQRLNFLQQKKKGIVYIPGQGYNIGQHSVVLVRGGRVRDVPGMHYKMIRNKFDFISKEVFDRKARRSKFGVVNPNRRGSQFYFKKRH
jgi:ribosomal protein S12